jgi:hypothetical protein
MVAVSGAIEITVHGWDISVACGARRPVLPGLAAVLLPIAPLLITQAPGLGCSPTRFGCPGPRRSSQWSYAMSDRFLSAPMLVLRLMQVAMARRRERTASPMSSTC